jgi:hypothetical protein
MHTTIMATPWMTSPPTTPHRVVVVPASETDQQRNAGGNANGHLREGRARSRR